MSLFGCQPDSSIEEYQNLSVTLSVTLFLTLPLLQDDDWSWKIHKLFWEKSSDAPNEVLISHVCKCRLLGLTNAKRPNQQIQISDQIWLKLKRWLAIIIFMSKLLMKSTSWRSGNVTHKVVTWRIKWRIDFDIPLMYNVHVIRTFYVKVDPDASIPRTRGGIEWLWTRF